MLCQCACVCVCVFVCVHACQHVFLDICHVMRGHDKVSLVLHCLIKIAFTFYAVSIFTLIDFAYVRKFASAGVE
jgi:hypothetical protein